MTHSPEFIFLMVSKVSHVMSGSNGRDLQWLPRKWIMFRWILLCAWSHLLNPYEVPCYSPALQLCSYCFYFPFRSYPSALRTDHTMFLLSQKYSFTSGTRSSCSSNHPHCISAIFGGQGSLIFLSPSYFPFFFLFLHILLSHSRLFALPI